jgi:hypothetical protein
MNGHISSEADEVVARLVPSLRFAARSRMVLPLLLFLTSHRPLAFVAGQTLWLCTPFELLIPELRLGDWAALLSHPQSSNLLEQMMMDVQASESRVVSELHQ